MFFVRPPSFLARVLNRLTWDFYGDHRKVYLTFDDGPTPVITPWVLEKLSEYGAKATFFCLGRNVDKYPDLYRQILVEGHSTGNHSYSHLEGFRASTRRYMDDIELAGSLINSRLFRPPYGRISPRQVKTVLKKYNIIMWDVLSNDYNTNLTGERVVRNVISNVKPGSIIVFHDSDKASENIHYALPRVMDHLKEIGYEMERIPDKGFSNNYPLN